MSQSVQKDSQECRRAFTALTVQAEAGKVAAVRSIAVGMLGLGNVGSGVARILDENREEIRARLGAEIELRRVLVRDRTRARGAAISEEKICTQASEVLGDPELDVVIELIGGIEPARTWVLEALRGGKHVITANKALIAAHGDELFDAAELAGRALFFEGAVAGGIPIIRTLREALASDRIERLVGILNGTSNFVLDEMSRKGVDYATALRTAQEAGYAEADPTLDVSGGDAAHKLAILCLLSFGVRVDPDAIQIEGIEQVRPFDISAARELGYVIKSLAIGELDEAGRPRLRVHPTMVPSDRVLAGVHGSYNAVLVESAALGRSLYYGQGAGMLPTGVAVASDLVELCRGLRGREGAPPAQAFMRVRKSDLASNQVVEWENYLCVHVPNIPGVLGRVASCLGRHGVSIKRMNQDTPCAGDPIDMVILTEKVADGKVQAAMAELDSFSDILAPTHRVRMLGPEVHD